MPDEDLDLETETDDSEGSSLRQRLRDAQKRNKEMANELEEAATARRELAFVRAEIGTGKTVDFFKAHYDGELSPDAIRAAAQEAGVVDDTPAQETISALDQMSQAGYGSSNPMGPTSRISHPGMTVEVPVDEAEMWRQFDQALANRSDPQAAQRAQEILRQFGRNTVGIEATSPSRTAGSPQTAPMDGPGYSGTPTR